MPIAAPWNNWFKKQKVVDQPVESSRLRRAGAQRRRKEPPTIGERQSSLYRYEDYVPVVSASSRNLDDNNNVYSHPSHPFASATIYKSHLYHLQENPSLFFPTPPPRQNHFYDRRHTDIWDDLFDHAECHSTVRGLEFDLSSTSPACHSTLDLTEIEKKRKFNVLGLKGLGMRSEIWSKSSEPTMASTSAPPNIPPRSRLRAQAPPPLNSQSFLLPVDEPILELRQRTPSLVSSASSDHEASPAMPLSPPSETIVFGKKKSTVGLGKDPLRIKDGAEPRRSTSGVYTPTTFPGASGPRPSHFPSHVYTPNSFTLHPVAPAGTPSHYAYNSASSSRSSSISSADSDSPATPGSRFSTFSGKAMTGLKRISHQIPRVTPTHPVKTPLSARDSYFPSSIGNDVQRVWAPQPPSDRSSYTSGTITPRSVSSGHGLGVGLSETDGQITRVDMAIGQGSVLFEDSSSEHKLSPQAKGKRKPVPRILDDQLSKDMGNLKVETHAL